MSAPPRPGWYPDPAGAPDAPRGFRWWDGAEWTDRTSESARSPAPSSRRRPRSRLRDALLLTLGFTLFVGASVTVGMLLWGEPVSTRTVRSPASAASGAGTPATEPPGQLDLHSRVATIGAASLILPDDPYELTSDPRTLPGLFDVLFMANAPVHGRYDGTRTWSATVLLGRISASVSGPGLESRSTAAFRRLSTTIFDGHPTRLRDVQWTTHPVSSCLGVLMTGRVHYAVAHLASRYDTVTAQVVQLPDHSLVMAVSSVPDDADPDVAAQAAAAVRSLTIR